METNVTEGRPDIQYDWQKEYEKQRQSRMYDAIDDYLNDDEVDARQVYEEMITCIDDVINYHKKYHDKAVKLKSLMFGHRSIDNLDSFTLGD